MISETSSTNSQRLVFEVISLAVSPLMSREDAVRLVMGMVIRP
jgi:hypothetical protein